MVGYDFAPIFDIASLDGILGNKIVHFGPKHNQLFLCHQYIEWKLIFVLENKGYLEKVPFFAIFPFLKIYDLEQVYYQKFRIIDQMAKAACNFKNERLFVESQLNVFLLFVISHETLFSFSLYALKF